MVYWLIYHNDSANKKSCIALSNDPVFNNSNDNIQWSDGDSRRNSGFGCNLKELYSLAS